MNPTGNVDLARSHVPPGHRDFLFEEAERRRKVLTRLSDRFEQQGFRAIITPPVEYHQVLVQGLGDDLRQRTYRFFDRDGQLLALRPDITPQVARVVATRLKDHPLPLRLYYSGEVFRFDEIHGGRDRALLQVGCELIGMAGAQADTEMVRLAIEALSSLELDEFAVSLGHVGYLNGLLEDISLGVEGDEQLRALIDTRDVSGLEQFVAALPIDQADREAIARLPRLVGGMEVLAEARQGVSHAGSLAALERLEQVFGDLPEPLHSKVVLDLGEVRGMAYYDGIVFRIYLPRSGVAVGGGGRYDHLVGRYGCERPAVGFSLEVDPLVEALPARLFTEGGQ